MGLLETGLALVGVAALIILAVLALATLATRASALPSEVDRAAPYREGLHAAMRIQTVAQDLGQQLYAEARRHLTVDPGGEP